MATTVNNLDQSIAWGITPSWVSKRLNNEIGAGSKTYKGFWGGSHTYHYTKHLTTIAPDDFDLNDWNGYNDYTKGSKSNNTYYNNGGGYGLNANTDKLTVNQAVDAVTYGTPTTTTSTETANNTNGQTVSVIVDNTDGSVNLIQTLTLQYVEEQSSNASTTNGYSETTTLSVGGSVSAEIAGIGESYNTTVTDATTIDSSSETGTTSTSSTTTSSTTTVEVPPGYEIHVSVTYTSQNITMPYQAPVSVEGASSFTDMYGNSLSYSVGDSANASIAYGVPNSEYVSGSGNTATYLATGYIYNMYNSEFTVTQNTIVAPSSASTLDSSNYLLGEKTIENNMKFANESERVGAVIKADGVDVETGLMYRREDSTIKNGVLNGSAQNDIIHMAGEGQSAYTSNGSDIVYGSSYADKIVSRGKNGDANKIDSGDGDDEIHALSGSNKIHAGAGNDIIEIAFDQNNSTQDITTGEGEDQIILDLNNIGNKTRFLIRDLDNDDLINYKNGSLDAKVNGSSVELFDDGNHVGTLLDYAHQFEDLYGNNLAESGLLNMNVIGSRDDHDSIIDWRDQLIEHKAEGHDLIESYAELVSAELRNDAETDDAEKLSKLSMGAENHIEAIVDRLVGDDLPFGDPLKTWAKRNLDNYESGVGLVNGIADRVRELRQSIELPRMNTFGNDFDEEDILRSTIVGEDNLDASSFVRRNQF